MGGRAAPLAIDPQPYGRVGFDVADIVGMVAMFGHHPELVVDHLPAYGGVPRLSGFTAGGFEHGHRQLPADRIDDQPLHAMD